MIGNERIVFETTSVGMRIQVIDKFDQRELRFGNRVVQSAVSLLNPDHLLLRYTQYMMLGLVLKPDTASVLHIGLGAGNLARFIHSNFPQISQHIVEKSDVVVSVAHRFFDLPEDPRIQISIADGEEWAKRCEKQYDLILLDAFEADGTPEHLRTKKFLKTLRSCLSPDGWIIGNVWSSAEPYPKQLDRWKQVFENVLYAPNEPIANVVVFGGNTNEVPNLRQSSRYARDLESTVPLNFHQLFQAVMTM